MSDPFRQPAPKPFEPVEVPKKPKKKRKPMSRRVQGIVGLIALAAAGAGAARVFGGASALLTCLGIYAGVLAFLGVVVCAILIIENPRRDE